MKSGISGVVGRLALAGAITIATAGAARAEDKPPVVARAEQCLRQKVDRVVAADPDVASAASFLVGYACAEEVAGATRYLRNETYVQLFASIARIAAAAGAKPASPSSSQPPRAGAGAAAAAATASAVMALLKVDPETGDIRMAGPAAQAGQVNSMLGQTSGVLSQFMPDNIPVPIRKLAGELVLEARERHKPK
ncbi:MAG: hypothetical protein ACXWKO_02965 [Phenylobacterium sp.]